MLEPNRSPLPLELRADVDRAVQILKEGGCEEVYLFGSTSRGDVHPESDLDFAVAGCPKGAFFRLLGQLMWELSRSADLVNLDHDDPFTEYLKQRGELVQVG
jgi:predicted nucleotidyltransferase